MPGSGIFSTFAYGAESAWGTYAVPTRFITVQKEGFKYKKGTIQEHVLHGGLYDLATRRAYVKKGATGSIDLALYDRGLGLMFKNMLGAYTGSTAGSVTTQTFFPADTTGLSMSVQVGRPMTNNSTIQAFTYEGTKVTEWEIGVKAGEFASFNVSFDSMQEDTAQTYAAPSYTASNILNAVEAVLILGGTPSTTASVTSISGGASVSLGKDISIKQTNPLDTERYYMGSFFKQEQLVNEFRQVTGAATIAFGDLTTVYNAFAADTSTALSLTLTGPAISGGTHSAVSVLIPEIFWDMDDINVEGPALIDQKITFTGLDNGVDNQVQIQAVTLDSAP